MAKQIITKSNLNTNFKFDNTNNKIYTDFVPQVTLAELRSFTAIDVIHKPVVYIKDAGKQGVFKYDSTDTSTVDNEGITIKLTSTTHRYKRELTSEGIYASWFKLTSDTDDSYCIQRAVAYSLAQSEYPDVIITKGKWLVNNNATVLTPSVGKKIRIVGKGNPIIDFTCQSSTDSLTSAVFRTPVAWTYPSSWTVNRNTNYGTIEIEGITFDGNRNPANNGSDTVWSRPLLFMECEKVNVFNNRFQNIPGTALQISVTSGGIISNNTFDKVYAKNAVDNTGDSITIVAYSENFVISDNICKLYTGQAGRIGITVDDYCRECQVVNNNIVGYERGIHVETSDNVIVKGNVIKKSPSAILFSQTTNCIADSNILDGSNIYANSQLANSALLFGLDDVNSIYRNNTIRNWSGVANTYLAKFFSTDAVIENNKFINSTSCQIWMYGNARQRNLLKGNVFTGAIDLILSVTDKSKIIGNKFYGGTFTADNTTDIQIQDNTFDVVSGSNTRTGLNLYNATRPQVLNNTFYNCSNYVIEQSSTTNGLFENNTHIRTHASAISNYFYVSSSLNATGANINSTRNNFVRDFISNKTYTVGNRNPLVEVTNNNVESYIPNRTISQLSSFTSTDIANYPTVFITDDGKEGIFIYDNTDTTSIDDSAIVIKTTNGNHVYKRKYKNTISVKWFGAKGDGVTDDTVALQTAINFGRNNATDVHLVSQAKYLISNKLVNQIDGNWKPLKLEGNNATLLCNTNGKTALELTGGYAMSHISNLNLLYSGTITTADTLTHGIVVNSTRINFKNIKVDGFCGDGFKFISQVPNMNSSIWNNIRSDNNKGYGFHISGTDDNISVIKADMYCENNGKSGVFVTTDSPLRDCDFYIYAENNCQIDLTKANVYFGKIANSYLTIYSEQVNSAEEIRLDSNCTDNVLLSFRNNKDYFSGSNVGIRGNKMYQQDTSRASTPLVLKGDYARSGIDGEYVRLLMQGVLGDYGDIRGEDDGIYVHRNGHKLGTTQDNLVAKSTTPFLIQTALKLYGDSSSVAAYINGDLAFRQQNGTNVYLDLSSTNSSKGTLIVRNSDTYEKVFQIKNTDAIFIKPTTSKTTANTEEGDIWYDNADDKIKYRRQNDIGVLITEAIIATTFTNLRNFTTSNVTANPIVYVTDSEREGIFVYDSSDTISADDNGIVIKTTTGNFVYKRKYDNAVNVKWFGAKGDGLTDDTTAIQTALTLYDDVFVPKGTYLVNSLNFKSNNTLRGDGKSAILKANFDTARIINIYNTSVIIENVIVENLTLDGGGQTTDIYTGIKRAYGVYISKAQNITINNLLIRKCGVMNPADPKVDVNFGGYGILAEARHGEIRNIRITNIDVFNIAGGGMGMGDGIMVNGFNNDIDIQPYGIVVDNVYIEHVGRHGISIGGEPPQSTSSHVSVTNIHVNHAALCGIALEDASYVHVSNFHFENCGNSTTYFVPSTQYGDDYNLLAGIAYGNLSHYNTFENGFVNNCQHGMTVGGGTDNAFNNITIQSSVRQDMSLKLAQIGARTRFNNMKLLTTGKPINPFYNAQNNADLVFENSYFGSGVEMGGLQDSVFRNCTFTTTFNINNISETKFLTFDKCKFFGTNYGFAITNFSALENITWDGCLFEGCTYGIGLVWNSIYRSKIINCYFKNCGVAVLHNNSDSQNAFDLISGNVFESCSTSLFFWQGLRECNIINNRFKNNSVWCIDFGTISAANGVYGLRITDNVATSDCNYGIRLELGGSASSFDHCFIADNDFGRVAVTPYNIASDNVNGYYVPDRKVSFNTQAGLSYQLGKFDPYRTLLRSHSADGSVVIPNDATLNYPVGTPITIENTGDTLMNITGLSSVVIDVSLEFKATIRPKGKAVIVKKSANTWSLSGDLIPRVMKVTSDLTSNSVTLADITNFTFPVKAGREYMIDVIIKFKTVATTTGVKLGCYLKNSGAGNIFGFLNGQVANTAASTDLTAAIINIGASNAPSSFLLTTGVTPANSDHIMQGKLIFTCTTSGDIQFQWASETPLSIAILVAGSRIFVKEI